MQWAITELPNQCQANTYTNADLLSTGSPGTNFSEILIKILQFSFKKMHLKMSGAKWRPFCSGLSVSIYSFSVSYIVCVRNCNFMYGVYLCWNIYTVYMLNYIYGLYIYVMKKSFNEWNIIIDLGFVLIRKIDYKSMSVNKNFLTWLLIGWRPAVRHFRLVLSNFALLGRFPYILS